MRTLHGLVLTLCLCYPSWVVAHSAEQATISIIIDDLGNNLHRGLRAIALPGLVSYAVLPYSPYSQRLARQAHSSGKEVMLHMPMDNTHGRPLGPGGLTESLERSVYEQRIAWAIGNIPHVSGINNHMGSLLTQNTERMEWLMQSIKCYPLYFVDSRTTADSVAALTARNNQIPTLQRDIFLDHNPSPAAIDIQFKRLINLARKQGSALAIGHPYPSTLAYLEQALPTLDAMGVRLVAPSGLLTLNSQPEPLAATVPAASKITLTASPALASKPCRHEVSVGPRCS